VLRGCLHIDPAERLTADELLGMEWFKVLDVTELDHAVEVCETEHTHTFVSKIVLLITCISIITCVTAVFPHGQTVLCVVVVTVAYCNRGDLQRSACWY
jgi:hypothetical protein